MAAHRRLGTPVPGLAPPASGAALDLLLLHEQIKYPTQGVPVGCPCGATHRVRDQLVAVWIDIKAALLESRAELSDQPHPQAFHLCQLSCDVHNSTCTAIRSRP
jgi:hypothetical protein